MKLRVYSLFAQGFQKGKMEWKRMAFEINLWPLHRQRVVINDFVLRDALITVQQNKGRNWVVGGIPFKTGSRRTGSGGSGKKGWDFGVSNIALSNVQIQYRGPDFNQKILIREAIVDTFRSWETEKKSRFSIKAMISGGELAISGRVDPLGRDRSVVSDIHISSLPLRWLSPLLQNTRLSGVDGVLSADFKTKGTLQPQNHYNLDATGKGVVNSINTEIIGLPFTIDASQVAYEGTFHSTELKPLQLRDTIKVTNMQMRDPLRKGVVLKFETGAINNIAAGNKSINAGTTQLQGVKSFVNTDTSGQQNSRPFAIETGVIDISDFSYNSNRLEIAVGSIALHALDASLVRDKDKTFRISKQLPISPKGNKPEKTESKPPFISINKFTIDGQSKVELMDFSVTPQVTLQATDLRFTLKDLYSSNDKPPGTYNLTATIRPQANLKADGTIGPIFPKPDFTVQGQINNFNVSQLSSYMMNLFGYEIDSGRLDGNSNGKVVKGKLDIVSDVKVNNLEITAVPSQTVYDKYKNAFMGMSLESALSLIKDKNGDVNLILPVNGNLSDPKFNFVDILRNAIISSISKGLNPFIHDSLP
jgi:hypothetical protein